MGLAEKIAELREEITPTTEDAATEETVTEETAEAEDGEVEQENTEEQSESDSGSTEEKTVEEKEKPEPAPDNAAMARLRREAAAAKKQAEEARAEIEALKKKESEPIKKEEEKAAPDPEPDRDDVEDHLRWEIRQQGRALEEMRKWREDFEKKSTQNAETERQKETLSKAVSEFTRLENEFLKTMPDYNDAARHMHERMVSGFKAMNPHSSDEEAVGAVNARILAMASNFARENLNPVEEIYHMAREKYGFTGAGKAQETAEKTASVEKIAENRKRSTSSLAGGSGSVKTYSMAGMTPQKLGSMTLEQRRALIKSLKD